MRGRILTMTVNKFWFQKCGWVLFVTLLSGWSFTEALAREFYSIPVSIQLNFVSHNGGQEKLGMQQGALRDLEKGGLSLKFASHDYKIENGKLGFRKFFECTEAYKERRPMIAMTLSRDQLQSVFDHTVNSFWMRSATKANWQRLIARTLNFETKERTVVATYCEHASGVDENELVQSLEFLAPEGEGKFVVTLSFGRQVSVSAESPK
ncbi:hypothetical protein WDW86_18200 [Bdellovibrionota bacterium FG-2]